MPRQGKPIQVWLDAETQAEFDRLVRQHGRSKSTEVRRAIWFYLADSESWSRPMPGEEPEPAEPPPPPQPRKRGRPRKQS